MSKVVIIDDNLDILSMWKLFLVKEGHEVITMSSAGEFKLHVDGGKLEDKDYVISDQSLGDGLGSEIYDYMLSKNIKAKFVIVSGYPPEDILEKVKSSETPEVLKKPVSLSDLKKLVSS